MKCQFNLFSGKSKKKNVINLLSAELAQRVVKVNLDYKLLHIFAIFTHPFIL